jgi:TolA-binding protein
MLMKFPLNAGQKIAVAGTFAAALLGCAPKSAPLPPASRETTLSPEVLAVASNDTLTRARFEMACKQANVAPSGNSAQTLAFWDEYVRYNLESKAAAENAAVRDSSRVRRWASIRERILTDHYTQAIANEQFGYTDNALDSLIAKDSVLRRQPKDSARIQLARKLVLKNVKIDSIYAANRASFKRPDSSIAPLDSVRASIEQGILSQKGQESASGANEKLRTDFKVEISKVERPAVANDVIEAFYKKNRDRWTGTVIYHLSALSSKDSSALRQSVSGKKRPANLAAFQTLAGKFPVGTPAVAPQGAIGRVKRNFALPYGIGMVPELFPALDSVKSGLVGPFKADSSWVAFWLESRDSATVKPLALVIDDVRAQYNSEVTWTPPASTVVARWDRGVLFTKSDVDFIQEEIPAHMRRQFPAERVLDFMIRWKVSARASAESGLLARSNVQTVLHDNENVYWAQAWRQGKDAISFLQSDSSLSAAWKHASRIFPKGNIEDSAMGVNRDAARLALMPVNFLNDRYETRLDNFVKDSIPASYDSSIGQIYRDARADLDAMGRTRLDSVLKARFHFRQFASAPHERQYKSLSEIYDSARSAYDRRDLETAEGLYRRIEKDYSKGDTLFEKALFQMGQLQGEKQNYMASLESYRKLLKLRPASNEAYKSQFMIAFTYSEYLKKEKRAVIEYRKVLSNYPNCELAKDADWMIRNIESGGALMPKFDDSTAAPTDTIAAKKAAAAAPAAKTPAKTEKSVTSAAAVAPIKAVTPVAKDSVKTGSRKK